MLYVSGLVSNIENVQWGKIAIKNRVTIDQRPQIVDTKQRFGDWEIDTIVGENNKGAIVTMVERKTAFMIMEKLEHGKAAENLTKQVTQLLWAYIMQYHNRRQRN